MRAKGVGGGGKSRLLERHTPALSSNYNERKRAVGPLSFDKDNICCVCLCVYMYIIRHPMRCDETGHSSILARGRKEKKLLKRERFNNLFI